MVEMTQELRELAVSKVHKWMGSRTPDELREKVTEYFVEKEYDLKEIRSILIEADKMFSPENMDKVKRRYAGYFITQDVVKKFESRIMDRCSDEDLEFFNKCLKDNKKGRITFFDVALIGVIHYKSITEHDGYSPYKRVVKLSKETGLLHLEHADYSDMQIAAAFDLLEGVRFTKRLEQHIAPSSPNKKGRCGRYKLTEETFWADIF